MLFIFALDRINIGIKTEDNIRVYGLLLQLLWIIIVIYSLQDKLILFKEWKLSDFIKDYFKRFPFHKIHKNLDAQGGIFNSSFASGDIRPVVRPKEDLKDIVRYFDAEIENINKRLMRLSDEHRSDINMIENKLANYKTKLKPNLAQRDAVAINYCKA